MLLAVFGCLSAHAADLVVPVGESLNQSIAQARPGDRLILSPGRYRGPVVVDRALELVGQSGVIIDGGGRGTVIRIEAPDVVIRGLRIVGSGRDLSVEDSGIFVTEAGDRANILDNQLENNLIGVYLSGPENAEVRRNNITGFADGHLNDRGNGVQLWNTPGSIVSDNTIRLGRDGIFVTSSKENRFLNNTFRDLRIAVHYMYTNNSEISGNLSVGNHVGYALMYSTRLIVKNNHSIGDRDHGILLNYANYSEIERNLVYEGKTKCVFIYNSNFNAFRENYFGNCSIGVHFTAGSESNVIVGNTFTGNRTQVKYVGTRWLTWSDGGVGNYWSDHTAFDLDGNGVADAAYRPNDLVDQVLATPAWDRPSHHWYHLDPLWDPLRDHPGFQALLEKYGQEAS